MIDSRARRWALLAALLAGTLALGACAPVVLGAMAGTTMVMTDRRSVSAQADDQAIELRGAEAAKAVTGDRARVAVTSYNRTVLLTGEVPTEADRDAVAKAVAAVAGVRAMVNELAVMPNATASQQMNDAVLTSRVKAALLDGVGTSSLAIKVVSERGVVYLMGLLTEAEARAATQVVRGVGGVQKVVQVFEIITPQELERLRATTAAPPPPPPQ
jgi:osmotically-inducible protein OsmY